MTLFYVVALLVAFYLLIVAEFFLPTGGILGIASVAVLAAAIGIAFSHSMVAGTSVIVFVLITTPMVIYGMLKAWPHTPIGRRMLNRRPGQTAAEPPQRVTSHGTPLQQFIGKRGTAKTDLLPGGRVTIEGEKIDAVSTGMPIDAGADIIVTSIEGGRVRVRAAGLSDDTQAENQTLPAIPQSPPSLEESLESFDIDDRG